MSPSDIISPVTSHTSSSPQWRLPPLATHLLLYMVGCHPRTLLQTCKLPHPLDHWCLCRWLWALFSVRKLSKCRFCGSVGCNPTYIYIYIYINKYIKDIYIHPYWVLIYMRNWYMQELTHTHTHIYIYWYIRRNSVGMLSFIYIYESESRSVISDSLRPHELYSPWNSPG